MVSPTAEAAVGGGLQKSSSTKPSLVQELVAKSPAEKDVSNFSRLSLTPLAQETETWQAPEHTSLTVR